MLLEAVELGVGGRYMLAVRYRLGRIKQLTGLDLGHHEDRMRADLALRLLQVNVGLEEENALAEGQ